MKSTGARELSYKLMYIASSCEVRHWGQYGDSTGWAWPWGSLSIRSDQIVAVTCFSRPGVL